MSETGERTGDAAAAGFTLIELLVALGILVLVLAVALPTLRRASDGMDLRAAANDIASALRETHSLALARGRAAVFTLDAKGGAYRVADHANWRRLPGDISVAVVAAGDGRVGATEQGIRFLPDGSSTGGAVRVVRGAAEEEIVADWLTGRISIVRSPGPASR